MLPTDYVLVTDKSFKKYAKAYADDQDLFFKEYVFFHTRRSYTYLSLRSNSFSKAFGTLLELGVPESQFVSSEPWTLKNSDEN